MYFICIYFSFINIIIDTRIIIIIMIVCFYVIIDYRSIRNPNKCIVFSLFPTKQEIKTNANCRRMFTNVQCWKAAIRIYMAEISSSVNLS